MSHGMLTIAYSFTPLHVKVTVPQRILNILAVKQFADSKLCIH